MKFPRKIKDAAPVNSSRESIEKVAELAAQKFGYAPGTDPAVIAAKLGVRVTHTTPDQEHSDELIAFADGKVVLSLIDDSVRVDGRTQRNREASDTAKAIGHLVLHLPAIREDDEETAMVVARYPQDEDGKRAGLQARWFAAAFLAPSDKIMEMSKRTRNRGDIAQTLMERNFLCMTLAKMRVSTVLGPEVEETADVFVLDA